MNIKIYMASDRKTKLKGPFHYIKRYSMVLQQWLSYNNFCPFLGLMDSITPHWIAECQWLTYSTLYSILHVTDYFPRSLPEFFFFTYNGNSEYF